jgi:hypothetical protein
VPRRSGNGHSTIKRHIGGLELRLQRACTPERFLFVCFREKKNMEIRRRSRRMTWAMATPSSAVTGDSAIYLTDRAELAASFLF